jgi:protein tyrosine/serine phosphatase
MSYNLEHLVRTDIATSIDVAILANVLSSPPFALVPGTFNVRDICPTSSQALRQGYIYRSGTLENIEELGMAALRDDLKVTTVFDLRSSKERQTAPGPEIPGIEVIFIPSTWDNPTRIEAQKPAEKEEYSVSEDSG